MKIYVACLASYNNGTLHGAWFDLEDYTDADDLYDAVNEQVLITSPYPNVEVDCPTCDGDGIHTSDPDDICSQCKGTGQVPSSEEWAIHDHEGFPYDAVDEYTSFSELYEIKKFYEEAETYLGRDYEEIVEAFLYCFGGGDMPSVEQIQDAYVGQYDSPEDFAEQFFNELGTVNEDSYLFRYIDWNGVWYGELQHDFTEHNDHYFRRNW